MEYMYSRFRNVFALNMKFRQAQVSGDFSIITEEDKFIMKTTMGGIA